LLLWNTVTNPRTILKKVKAIKPELSSMTLGLADCIETSIRRCFNGIFDSRSAVISVPKFKLRWMETQQMKDSFKHMLLDEMRLHDVDDVAVVKEESQSNVEKKTLAILNQMKKALLQIP